MRDFSITELKPSVISANFEEVEADLRKMMTAYDGLEVTEETYKERKEDKAALNKMKKAIEDKRKEIKKQYNVPLNAFEAKCKGLVAIIEEQTTKLENGIALIDAKRIQEKQAEERRIYDEHIGEWSEYLPFDAVKKSKWDNKSYTENAIITDIEEAILTVRTDIRAIKAMQSEFEDELIRTYKDNGNNLALTMQRESQLRSAKQIAERKASEDAQRAKEDADRQTVTETQSNATERHTDSHRYILEVFTEEDYDLVTTYMQLNCIKYQEG